MEIEEPRQTCPSCGRMVDSDSWCGRCANFRQLRAKKGLVLLIPILGLIACSNGYEPNGSQGSSWVQFAGTLLVINLLLLAFIWIGVGIWKIIQKRRGPK